MKGVIVRYKAKHDRAAENEALIRAVFQDLEKSRPAGVRYMSLKLADGVSFVHIAFIETEDGSNPLITTAAFKTFAASIKDRCDEQPVAADIAVIGSYRFGG